MTRAVLSWTVTAKAEHIPRICPDMGLLFQMGVKNTSNAFVRVNLMVCFISNKLAALTGSYWAAGAGLPVLSFFEYGS
jgi:hypothetical protein